MTRIDSKDVQKVAKLARLEIPSDDIETYASQLENILEYIAQLQKIDTSDVKPTTRAVEVVNVLREDFVEESPIREEILNLAPKKEGEFYKVPKILSD